MKIYVDKIELNDLGGQTTDIRKVQYNLALFGISLYELVSSTDSYNISFVFGHGKYVFFVFMTRDYKKAQMSALHADVSIDDHFNSFADNLTPKSVQSYHELQVSLSALEHDDSKTLSFSSCNDSFEQDYENRRG